MKRKDNIFTSTALSSVESNQFDLSHDKKFTCNMGELIPVTCLEVLPGDSFNISYVNFLRFLPLIAPVMHRVRVMTEYFFVPNRIIYGGWEGFITGTDNPPLAAPRVTLDDVINPGTLADYLGVPPGDYSDVEIDISPLQVAAYYKIYDDWYRDQNLIGEKYVDMVPGDNIAYLTLLNSAPLRRAWEHDYFTSCLPTTQQGTEVEIPLTSQSDIPVEMDPSGVPWAVAQVSGAPMSGPAALSSAATSNLVAAGTGAILDPKGNLTVDINAGAASINDLRRAFSLQAFLERSLRGGLRYIEQIWSHFQVKSSDARLMRPEFLGRSVQNMTIGEVLATAQSSNDGSTAEVAVGTMAGHGISTGGSGGIHYTAEEHGFIIGIMSVIPDTAYQDGISRQFTRFDRLDYAFPEFAHIGEQAVLRKEIHAVNALGFPADAIFGYVPRYAEYRYHPSQVAGDFRDTLAYWTLARRFDEPDNPPALTEEFIECNPRTDIFAVIDPNIDHVIAQVINNITVRRKLPRYGVPSSL